MKWKTKTGEVIDIKDMSDSHLKNAIAFIERDIAEYPGEMVYTGESEFAEQAVESENEHNRERLERLNKSVNTLKAELLTRQPNP